MRVQVEAEMMKIKTQTRQVEAGVMKIKTLPRVLLPEERTQLRRPRPGRKKKDPLPGEAERSKLCDPLEGHHVCLCLLLVSLDPRINMATSVL